MKHVDLSCVVFPDIQPWERKPVEALLSYLSAKNRVQMLNADESWAVDWGKVQDSKVVWAISRDWKLVSALLRRIDVPRSFLSVFGLPTGSAALMTLFVRRLRPTLSKSAHILTHSPINFRFFREIEEVQNRQVSYVHLPFTGRIDEPREASRPFRVATLTGLNGEGNINYFANVAHYVQQFDPTIQFRVIGEGKLQGHFEKMASEMGVTENFEICPPSVQSNFSDVDVAMYIPLRNHHFVPVLLAGASGVPVLASEVPGIADYIQDGKDGFVIPIHETKPMGELILRLKREENLRRELGKALEKRLTNHFSFEEIGIEYQRLFFGSSSKQKPGSEIAA